MGKKKRKEIEKLQRSREKDLRKLQKLQEKRALMYIKMEEDEINAGMKQMYTDWHKEVMEDVKKAKKEKKRKEKEMKKANQESSKIILFLGLDILVICGQFIH